MGKIVMNKIQLGKQLCLFFRRINFTIAVVLLLVPANSTTVHALENMFQVGVLYWSMNIPGQVAMRKGLEEEAAKINRQADSVAGLQGVNLLVRVTGDGDKGIELQMQQMYDLVKQKPDILIVQPTDNAALAGPLMAANRAKIPVVTYDQYISGGKIASYLTSDNYQAGYLNGEYVAAYFQGKKTLNIILVDYPHVSSTVERVDGFFDALQENGQSYLIIKTYEAVEPVGGRRAGKMIILDFPRIGSVDVVFTVNDGGGLSVVDVLAEAGRDEIFIATSDGDPVSITNIQNQRLTRIDSAQFCGPLGAETMKTAYSILCGEKVASQILVPVFPVTRETIDMFPGWQGPIPKQFKKPWPTKNPYWDGRLKNKRISGNER